MSGSDYTQFQGRKRLYEQERQIVSKDNPLPAALYGTNDAGEITSVPVTQEGHVEVAIHAPRLPFGSIHAESLTPVFQSDAVYQINPHEEITTTSGSGTVTNGDGMYTCATGGTIYSFGSLQSNRRLRYRPGQGVIVRFTSLFSAPVADSIVVSGAGTGESGFYFGYNGTSFGILHSNGGMREIQLLTVTTGSSTAENLTITLAGTAFSVAVTNSGNATLTAFEISQGTYAGWRAEQKGSSVEFIANAVGDKTGTFSLAGTSAVGTFSETTTGVATTDIWYPQTQWTGDKLDGTGASGVTLDPTKGNVFQIDIQYLGFGAIIFKVEVITAGNNADFVTVHTIAAPNNRTTPTVSQPSFPFTMAAYSAGSTTNVFVKAASYSGFIEGMKRFYGPQVAYRGISTAVSTGAYYCLYTIRNSLTFKSRPNQSVINLVSFGGCHDDATPVEIFLLRDATLLGTPNFVENTSHSPVYVDSAATTCTISDNDQIIYTVPLGQTGTILMDLIEEDIQLQPGETMTVAARAVFGSTTYTLASLNTREDQ